MIKRNSLLLLLFLTPSIQAATVIVDFQINVAERYTSIDSQWVLDQSFISNQSFILSASFNSEDYNAGTVDYWAPQDMTSVRPDADPLSFGSSPYDSELDNHTAVLDYGSSQFYNSGYTSGSFSYNGSFDRGRINLDFSQRYGSGHWVGSYLAASYFNGISISYTDHDALLTAGDIIAYTLDEYLQFGAGRTFSFTQEARESHGSGVQSVLLDGGISYQGTASIASITTVPVPAAAWLFGSGLIGLIGFARHKRT